MSPFTALVPVSDVAARTLDGSLRSAERAARRTRHPRSVAWLEAWGAEDVASVDDWVADGSLVVDARPRIRVVEQRTVDGTHTIGLLGAVRLDDLVPHEQTDPGAVARRAARDRVQEVEARPLLTVLSRDPAGLTDVLADLMNDDPETDVTDDAGARHRVWTCPDAVAREICAAVSPVPCLLADGHHRAAAATVLGRSSALAVVTLASHAPRLLPVWRIAAVPRGHDEEVAAWLDGLPSGTAVTVHARGRRRAVAGLPDELAVETSQRVAESVPAVARVTTTADPYATAVAERDGAVLVHAAPPTVQEVLTAVAAGRPLPPKSTAFTPKPRVGFVLRRV